MAEALISGERRLCARGLFNMVAPAVDGAKPPLVQLTPSPADPTDRRLRMVEMVFLSQTNHYATLYGGDALAMMGKAAFIASTRHARAVMVMAASQKVDFRAPILEGQMVELRANIVAVGRSTVTVEVELWGEQLLTGVRNHAGSAEFVMVAVDRDGRARALDAKNAP